MKAFKPFIFGLSAVVTGVVVVLLVFRAAGSASSSNSYTEQKRALHYYDQQPVPLGSITLDLVYFVAKDAQDQIYSGWQKTLEIAASRVSKFYETQFEGLAKITPKVYPKAVIGDQERLFYNGDATDSGNPNALRSIGAELKKKLFAESEDKTSYHILGIIYEDVGAAGSGDLRSFLVAREYLTREPIVSTYGISIFAHEFGHTMGMPDLSYGEKSDIGKHIIFTGDDIMGTGRFKPLSLTYLSNEIKKHMIEYAKN